jgi:hypothetical protein
MQDFLDDLDKELGHDNMSGKTPFVKKKIISTKKDVLPSEKKVNKPIKKIIINRKKTDFKVR